jgi:hypothetical protein
MSTVVNWKFVTESMFPMVVNDARRAGLDTTGWVLDSREGPERLFGKLASDDSKAVETVWHRFATAKDADLFFQGLRWTFGQMSNITS